MKSELSEALEKAVWIDVKEQYYVLFGTHIAPFFSFLHLEILNRNTSFFH